jgi:uncharacterized iron-regulated protein
VKANDPGIGIDCMKPQKVVVILAQFGALALAGCTSFSSVDSDRTDRPTGESSLSQARIIYVAETHNDPAHHQLQERIIRSLHQGGHAVTVGMEMIDITQQSALDRYLAKKISWATFAQSTDFESGWGKTSPAYRRILEWCRRNRVPILGLNAPQAVTRKIARNQKLTSAEAALVPDFPKPPGGFQKFQAAMGNHPGTGSIRRYYQAQRAWDATMAATILSWLGKHQGTLVVLLGQMHADAQTGVPWYVANESDATQVIIYPKGRFPTVSALTSMILGRYASRVWGSASRRTRSLRRDAGKVHAGRRALPRIRRATRDQQRLQPRG